MSTLKVFSIFIAFTGLAASASAAETVNYDDPNLAFTSQYVGDQKPEVSPTVKTVSEGDVAQGAMILFNGAPLVASPRTVLAPSSGAH